MTQTRTKLFAGIIKMTVLVAIAMLAWAGFLVAAELSNLVRASGPLYIQGFEVPSDISIAIVARDILLLVLSAACVVLYLRFCTEILQSGLAFNKTQSHRMLFIGMILIASSALAFACDSIVRQLLPASTDIPLGIFVFSPWMLVVALFALSLSFIFEYGRLLQEDNNSII